MKTSRNVLYTLSLLLSIITCFSLQLLGQVDDSSFHKEFNSFNKQINQEFDVFRSHNDSVFIRFLQESWKEFKGNPHPIPETPKPSTQPVYHQPDALPDNKENTPHIQESENEEVPGTLNPIPEKESLGHLPAIRSFSFYGTRIALPRETGRLPALLNVSSQSISKYYSNACSSGEFNSVFSALKEESINCRLNDWGLASLLFQASKSFYSNVNEQVLFTWTGLLRSGYNAKVGYSGNRVFLLLPADILIYTISYTVNDKDYYLLEPGSASPKPERLFIHEADYPGNKADFSFRLIENPTFKNHESFKTIPYKKPLHLTFNKNLLDFYENYPPCDLQVYLNTPLSATTSRQLDAYFSEILKEKSDVQRLEILLDYVQQAIRYLTDKEQFGHERYFFPDETLFYKGADCEDRSTLLAALIKKYTSLDFIVLGYPAHVSLAVSLTACSGNDFLMYDSRKFYHADPTFLGAECGMAMPEVKNKAAEIIYSNF